MGGKHQVLKSYVMKDFKRISRDLYGPIKGAEVYRRACAAAVELAETYRQPTKPERVHFWGQILPFAAVYRTMQEINSVRANDVLQKIIENRSRQAGGLLRSLLKVPGLYKLVPKICNSLVVKTFGGDSGFVYGKAVCGKRVWKADILRCPYWEACKELGCPEIAHYFCDSDDLIYGSMHKKLHWKRTKTLGRGQEVCDFHIEID